MDTRVKYYSLTAIHKKCGKELEQTALRVINSEDYVGNTAQFEEEFAEYTGAKY